ncbi:mpv17-like protein isoform X2 [Daktulosphaira vitifoliae]|nr:mpv17-like protein isoform X2 [Daktulosphaira vitifoliae]
MKKHPILLNSTIYGTMYVSAELLQQILTKQILNKNDHPEPVDKGVLVRYAIMGSCITSNILFFWYKWLDKNFIGTAPKTVIKKLLLDQFVMSPPFYVIFYTTMSVMEGKSNIFEECKKKFVPTYKMDFLFWPPAQVINFLLVPPTNRIIYMSMCSFVWINILCCIKRKDLNML